MRTSCARTRSPWFPLLLSALVYPGAGQLAQRRIGWAMVYGLGFTLFFALLCLLLFRLLRQAWFGEHGPSTADLRTVAKPLAMALGIHLANVYDVWNAEHRRRRAEAAQAAPVRPDSAPGEGRRGGG